MNDGETRGLTPEQALDEARTWATTTRRLAARADEELAEAVTRRNQAGGETVPEPG